MAAAERHLAMLVAYDGTQYHGFQRQRKGLVTIQELIENALALLFEPPVRVKGAGRTDAGVHAWGQVVSFHGRGSAIPAERLPWAVNAHLPPDVVVQRAWEVPRDFDARKSATGKVYRYYIWNQAQPWPMFRRYAWHVPRPLDWEAMKRAAALLVGQHDFASFRDLGSSAKRTVRTIRALRVCSPADLYGEYCTPAAATTTPAACALWSVPAGAGFIEVEADGFLYRMVRIIAGTLVEVGLGRRSVDSVAAALALGDRASAGVTAPPQGLVLVAVFY